MTGRVHSVAMNCWHGFGLLSGLTGRQTEGVEINMLSLIVPRVIRISQDCQKGVTECNNPKVEFICHKSNSNTSPQMTQ